MVRRVLAIVGLVTALLVGGLAPAAVAAPASAAPAALSVPAQQGGNDEPPPPTCEPNIPPVPDPNINYCSRRERVLIQVRAQLQRVAERVQNPRARAALQRVITRLR